MTFFRDEVKAKVKRSLIQCAAPDAISRLSETSLSQEEQEDISTIYHMEQRHSCLSSFLGELDFSAHKLVNVTTSSRLLTKVGRDCVAKELKINERQITVLSLQQFDTEDQFAKSVRKFIKEQK